MRDIIPSVFVSIRKQVSPMQSGSFPVPSHSEVLAIFNTLFAYTIATNRAFWLFFFFPRPHMPEDHKKLNTLNTGKKKKKNQIYFIPHRVLKS